MKMIQAPGQYVWVAAIVVVFFTFLNSLKIPFADLKPFIDVLTNSNEKSVIEFSEALFWFISFLGFSYLAVFSFRQDGINWKAAYYTVFAILSFLVCGEELSWGQHLGFFEASDTFNEINAQGEVNFHNTNLSLMLGIPESSRFYDFFFNAGHLLHPAFHLFLVIVLGVAPLVINKYFKFSSIPLIKSYPIVSFKTSIFIIMCYVGYWVIDKMFYDVGEILEFGLASTALLALWDRFFFEHNPQPNNPQQNNPHRI